MISMLGSRCAGAGADRGRTRSQAKPHRRASLLAASVRGYTEFTMRLTDFEKQAISAAVRAVLPHGALVSLFGSRLHDERRGGDLDLLVELPPGCSADEAVRLRSSLAAQLYRLIGGAASTWFCARAASPIPVRS